MINETPSSILFLSNDLEKIKAIYNECINHNLVFYFVDSYDKCLNFLKLEDITVCIIDGSQLEDPIELVDNVRQADKDTSFIYIGESSFERARIFLKRGIFDYLSFGYSSVEIINTILEAAATVDTYKKIKSLDTDLEKANKVLLEKTIELEYEKKQLHHYIDNLNVIERFVKQINISKDTKEIAEITASYLRDNFNNDKILFTVIDGFTEKILSFRGFEPKLLSDISWDLRDMIAAPWANSIINAKSKVVIKSPKEDVWYYKSTLSELFKEGFVKVPLLVGNNVFGTIIVSYSTKSMEEYLNLIAEHVSIAIHNKKLNEDMIVIIEQIKQYQEQIIESEKMATIAKVAVSVNHEINNPLCAISLNTEILKRKFSTSPDVLSILGTIEKNIEIINKITNKFANMRKVATKEYLPGIDMLDLSESK